MVWYDTVNSRTGVRVGPPLICGGKNKDSEYICASGCRSQLRSLRNNPSKFVRTTKPKRVTRHTYLHVQDSQIFLGLFWLNAAAASTAGQQHTGIILWSTTPRQQLYSTATDHVFIWYGADTRSRRENDWFAVWVRNKTCGCRWLFYFEVLFKNRWLKTTWSQSTQQERGKKHM